MSFIRKAYIYLLIYIFWEFLITYGRFLGSPMYKHVGFIVTFLVFLVCLLRTRRLTLTIDGRLWIPFFLLTVMGALVSISPGLMFIWAAAFIVMAIAIDNRMHEQFPYKLIIVFGAIQMVGQLMQVWLPAVYNGIMNLLLVSDYHHMGTGLQGFTTQTGMIAIILVYTLGTYICFYASKRTTVFNVVTVLLIYVAIFFTGKRSASFFALLIPLLVFLLSAKDTKTILKYGVIIVILGGFFSFFAIQNADMYGDTVGLKKLQSGVEMFMDEDEELDLNGREFLWDAAIRAYEENPVFGIGIDHYSEWSGIATVHNMYLQVLCEQGLVGFIPFIIPLAFCFLHTLVVLRRCGENSPYLQYLRFSLFVQLYFILYGFTGNPTHDAYGYVMYFCAIGVFQCCLCDMKEEGVKC